MGRQFWAVVGVLCGVTVAALAAPAQAPTAGQRPADEAQERKKLVGVWKGYAVEGTGEKADSGPVKLELKVTETTIHGLEFKQFGSKEVIDHGAGTFALNLSADPRHLDATQAK